MRFYILFIALLYTFCSAESQTLYGYVRELNSGNKPVGNVVVKGTFANQVVSTDKGEYTLQYQTGKPGKTVYLDVVKEGWVVTDRTKLSPNLPSDPFRNPHIIVVCPKEKWNNLIVQSKNVCEKGMRLGFEKRIDELNSKVKELSSKNRNFQQTVDSLNNLIELVTQQYQTNYSEENITKFAVEHSKQNLDEITQIELKAYQLFNEGKIEESLALRESMKSIENIERRNSENISLQQTIENNKAANEIDRRNLKQQAKEAQLLFKWDKVEATLEYLARDTTDLESLYSYADFLKQQNKFQKSQAVFEKLLNILKANSYLNNWNERLLYANSLNNYGNLLRYGAQYLKAKESYILSLEQFNLLGAKNTSDLNVLSKYAWLLSDMGNNYRYLREFDKANIAHDECIKIRRYLYSINQNKYQTDYAKILHNYASNLREQNKLDSVLSYYNQSLRIWNKLDNKVEQAHVISSIAKYYFVREEYDSASVYYEKAVMLRKILSKENTYANEPKLAQTYSWVSVNSYFNNNLGNAKLDLLTSNEIFNRYINTEPKAYLSYLSENYNYLWLIMLREKVWDDVERYAYNLIDLCLLYDSIINTLDAVPQQKILISLAYAYLLQGNKENAERIVLKIKNVNANQSLQFLIVIFELTNGNNDAAIEVLRQSVNKLKPNRKNEQTKTDLLNIINYMKNKKNILLTDKQYTLILDVLNL